MLNMIAAALVAAAPTTAPPAPSADPHAQHRQMGEQAGAKSEMKECCCKDMAAKGRPPSAEDHATHPGR